MKQERLEDSLEGIRQLLSHLHGEITELENCYSQVLLFIQKLEGQAGIDELTDLNRRSAFFDKWRALLEACRGLEETCGILLIDIDRFKDINDTHGHLTGDQVIRNVAALLKRFEMPGTVVAGRYGGEEFALAVRGSEDKILEIAEAIRSGAEHLSGPVIDSSGNPSSKSWRCTLSVGTASTAKLGYAPERLVAAADEALYSAKRSGRNRVRAA